ncbi:MAG: hypothetical protein JWP35_3880 [Caulobacter sp.]|nr:hypothetical protein [Caulobacter sp.]
MWWDAALRPGEAFDEVIEAALKAAKAVVVLWSPRSVISRWVRAEATLADRNKTLAPVIIEPCERPIMFELTQTANLCHWQGEDADPVWRALVADVRNLVGERPAPPPIAAAGPVGQAEDSRPSILVLPFVNMSGDPEQEFFSDGVTEDIITDLCRISALSVMARSTAFSYKGKPFSGSQLKASLGVTHIVEGSIRKSGERVRITAQLLDAGKDTQIWGERFDRTLEDIFAIQDEISAAIVGALKVTLAPGEKNAIEQRQTANAEAYELYLMARDFNRNGSDRMAALILRICQRAVDLDPMFGPAWAQLAFAEADLAYRGAASSSIARAMAAAHRAIEISPDLAEAHAALAKVIARGPDINDATGKQAVETALRLDPECFEAHASAGYCAIGVQDYPAAIHHYEKAVALDPISYRETGMLAQAYASMGEREKSRAASRLTVERCEKILATEPDHGDAIGFLMPALAELGEFDRARYWARRGMLFCPEDIRLHYNMACGMVSLGDLGTACDLLDSVIDRLTGAWMRWLETDSDFDPLRGTPRFDAILARGQARIAALEAAPGA